MKRPKTQYRILHTEPDRYFAQSRRRWWFGWLRWECISTETWRCVYTEAAARAQIEVDKQRQAQQFAADAARRAALKGYPKTIRVR